MGNDWDRVIFSDETIVRQFSPNKMSVRRPKNRRYDSRYVSPTVRSSKSIMIWASISSKGRCGIWIMPSGTTMRGSSYRDMLEEKLRPWLTLRNCDIFQHDGAPCHRSTTVRAWLQENGIQVLEPWPGSSPDLNPIENCWVVLKREIRKRKPASLVELRRAILEVWTQDITEELCKSLVHSMPARIRAVLEARGRQTKY